MTVAALAPSKRAVEKSVTCSMNMSFLHVDKVKMKPVLPRSYSWPLGKEFQPAVSNHFLFSRLFNKLPLSALPPCGHPLSRLTLRSLPDGVFTPFECFPSH